MRDDDKLVRQLSLVAFLMSQHRPVTADEIHENVEGYGGMSEQAFLRRFYSDRSELEAMGFSLTVERPGDDPFQRDLYALPPESYYLPAIDFDEPELSALQTCLYLLEGQFAYAEPLRLALQHLTLGRPSPLDDHAARTVAVNLLGPGYSPDVAAYLTKIESAIGRRKTIRFSYYSIGRDERSQREVDPYSLLYAAGNWYVVGYSHEREATRIFRLSRIEGRITFKSRAEHDFPPPRDFDLSPYRDRAPWQLAEPTEAATIALTPTIAWWVDQMFGQYGTFEAQPDGSGVFTTPYGSERELLTWILGLGADAEVSGPPELRASAISALELVRDRHAAEPPETREQPSVISVTVAEQRSTASAGPITSPDRVVPAERFTRLLALMTRLLSACGRAREGHVSTAELRTGLNLSQRELEDDIALLNLINFGGGCYALFAQVVDDAVVVFKETYGEQFARPARLSPLEAKALLWALEFIGDRLPIGDDDPLASAREKIEAAIGEDRLPPIELGRVQTANSAVAAAITRAIREDRVVDIEYWTEARGAITTRSIEPHLLVNARDAWYVVGWCRRAEEQRTFRLDRVRSAKVTKATFKRRSEMTAGPYLPWGDRPASGGTLAQSASVWCSPSIARWLEEEHPSSERHSDGSVLVEIPYASEEWLVKELVKHQGEAVLFEPVSLRRTVAKSAETILKRYRPTRRKTRRTPAGSSGSRGAS
jgi:predicted DNA-binding transcriptional regulator YafY